MNRCPITYEKIDNGARYSKGGLTKLSRKLDDLLPFPYNADEQLRLGCGVGRKDRQIVRLNSTGYSAVITSANSFQCLSVLFHRGNSPKE